MGSVAPSKAKRKKANPPPGQKKKIKKEKQRSNNNNKNKHQLQNRSRGLYSTNQGLCRDGDRSLYGMTSLPCLKEGGGVIEEQNRGKKKSLQPTVRESGV